MLSRIEQRENFRDLSSLLLRFLLIALSVIEPFQERLGGLADLFAGGEVDVFLAGLGAPILEHVFGNKVLLVEGEQYLGDLRDKLGMFIANETLGATQEGFFVTLRGDHLLEVSDTASNFDQRRSTNLLEHAGTSRDLFDDEIVKDGLSKNGQSLVFGLDS